MKISDLTYKVVAFAEIPDYDTDECVDWAMEMIFLGHETHSLLTLAGINKPTNYFEIAEYLPKVLESLKLKQMMGENAVLSYCSYYISKIAASENIRLNLAHVYKFCQATDYDRLVYDFYLLHWAWDDFDYGQEYTYYWENASKDNIESITVEIANKWIAKNEQFYIQHL